MNDTVILLRDKDGHNSKVRSSVSLSLCDDNFLVLFRYSRLTEHIFTRYFARRTANICLIYNCVFIVYTFIRNKFCFLAAAKDG